LIVVACVGGGCASARDPSPGFKSDNPPAEGSSCVDRVGTYSLRYTHREGTCGPIPEQIFTLPSKTFSEMAEKCTDRTETSADNCEVFLDAMCPEPGVGAGFTGTTTGKILWEEDGSEGHGVVQVVLRDPGKKIACQSTYNAHYQRQ
jgi:hypothetical protein